jgi:hypothetical protein
MSAFDPMDLMSALVLDDEGTLWGDIATDWQKSDAESILRATDPDDVRLFFLTRPRNGSKTTDLAGVLIVVMLTQAPRRSTSHAYARDQDQAGILLDEFRALAERTGLIERFDFGSDRVTVKATRAVLRVESADAGSAYGRRPFFVVADELAQWPTTRQARTLWEAVTSGLVKRKDSRFVAMTSAGDPAHWSNLVIVGARESDQWRVSETPGPVPWVSEKDLAEQRRLLPASTFARLHLNIWSAGEDRLVTPADLAACVRHEGWLPYDGRHSYQLGLDLGWVNDATVISVCHAEPGDLGPVIVLDRMHVLQGTREHPVQLNDVKKLVEQTSRMFGWAPLRVDPREAVAMAQDLRDRGMRVDDRQLTVATVGQIGGALHLLLREHRVALPGDDPDLLDELASVRLEQTSLGGMRLNHDAGNHDDRAMSLGLAAVALLERATSDYGAVSSPAALSIAAIQARARGAGAGATMPGLLAPYARRSVRGVGADIAAAQRAQTPAQKRAGLGLIVPGTANDPGRVTRGPRG